MRCSAKDGIQVDEVFHLAEQAVNFPLYPLSDRNTKQFTSKYKYALHRIFRCFDIDSDGLLSDTEWQSVQKYCFNESLSIVDNY